MAYNRRKRKVKKNIPEAVVHIKSTYNNTIKMEMLLAGHHLEQLVIKVQKRKLHMLEEWQQKLLQNQHVIKA